MDGKKAPQSTTRRTTYRRSVLVSLGMGLSAGCLQLTDQPADATGASEDGTDTTTVTETGTKTTETTTSGETTESPGSPEVTPRWNKNVQLDGIAVGAEMVVVGGQNGVGIQAFAVESGERLWQTATDYEFFDGVPVIEDTSVIIGSGDGTLFELDLSSGDVSNTLSLDGSVNGPPAIGDSALFVVTDNANDEHYSVYGIERDAFEIRWRKEFTGNAVYRGGVVYEDTFHASFANFLHGFSVQDGSLSYQSGEYTGEPKLRDGYLFYVQGRVLKKVDPVTLATEWAFDTELQRGIAIDDANVYLATETAIMAVNRSTGEKRWGISLDRQTWAGPGVTADYVWIAVEGALIAVAKQSGSVVWEQETENLDGIVGRGDTLVWWTDSSVQAAGLE